LGGMMIFVPEGKIIFHYKQKFFGDFPENEMLLKALTPYLEAKKGLKP